MSLEDFIALFDRNINLILKFSMRFTSVSIIGHSIGGILARYYVKFNEKMHIRKVSLLITIASPYYEILHSL